MPRNGFAGAVTWMPAACRRSITPLQLEASANAPWTRTTVRGALDGCSGTRVLSSSVGIDFDDGVGKRSLRFLRDVVADAALDRAVRIPGREDQRSGLNAARSSAAKSSGSSQAGKWPPLSALLK